MTQNQIAWFVANENRRHNLVGETIDQHKADSQRISARAATSQAGAAHRQAGAAESQASAAHRQAGAAEINSLANAKNADTNRLNADTNWFNAQTQNKKQRLDQAGLEWKIATESAKLNLDSANLIQKFLP